MATNYFPTSLEGQIGTSGAPVPIASPAASEVWCIHTLSLTSITGVPVSVILYIDALEYCSFDIPGMDVVEFRWGGPGSVINPSSVFSIEVDVVDVINYKVDGVVGTATGAGAVISVEDDGFEVESDLVTLNFTGAGVVASQTAPGIVEVAIPGGGGGKQSSTIIVGNDPAGDTIAICDYLDIGDGAQLQAALTAAGVAQVDVFIRRGTYNLGLAGSPLTRLTVPEGVRVLGAGRNQVTIITRDGGDGAAFLLANHCALEEVTISCTPPTALITGAWGIIESADPDGVRIHGVTVDFPGWSATGPYLDQLYIAISIYGAGTETVSLSDLLLINTDCPTGMGFTAIAIETIHKCVLHQLDVRGFSYGVTSTITNTILSDFHFLDLGFGGCSGIYLLGDPGQSFHISNGVLSSPSHFFTPIEIRGFTGGSIRGVVAHMTALLPGVFGFDIGYSSGVSISGCSIFGDFQYCIWILESTGCSVLGCDIGTNTYVDLLEDGLGGYLLGNSEIAHCFSGGRGVTP